MSQKRSKAGWKLIILLIVSAAFILARFGIVSANEVKTQKEAVAVVQTNNQQDKTVSTGLSGITTNDESLVGPLIKLLLALVAVVGGIYGFVIVL